MNNVELKKHIESRVGCPEALDELKYLFGWKPDGDGTDWLGGRDSARMWAECLRPEGLLWYASAHVSRQELVLAVCDCAEMALRYVPENENRPRLAIETARKWAVGKGNAKKVKKAARNAAEAGVALCETETDECWDESAVSACYAASHIYTYPAATLSCVGHAAYASVAVGQITAARAANAKMCRLIRQRWPVCPEAK